MTTTIDGTLGLTTPTYGGAVTAEYQVPVTGFKNRIINGAMMIDQRNAGASVSVSSGSGVFATDRFKESAAGGGIFSAQQSSVAPAGFSNSTVLTVTTPDSSIASTDNYWIGQQIEGYNVADLGYGAAGASTLTLSFWVRSSLTGTFSGSLNNSAYDRSYIFQYTINSANTWEQKTITIAGDTSGTWLKTNGNGLYVIWSLGCGSAYSTSTTGSWVAGGYQNYSSAVNWIATNGATFYITGVQLEKGSTATSFDYRPYGTELALCQRYYYLWARGAAQNLGSGGYYSSTYLTTTAIFPVTMRTAPTLSQTTGTDYYIMYAANSSDPFDSFNAGIQQPSTQTAGVDASSTVSGTMGYAGRLTTNNASSFLAFSAEL